MTPENVHLVVGAPAALANHELRAPAGASLVVVTHDREACDFNPAVAVVEIDELLQHGTSPIESAWRVGVYRWLNYLFPDASGVGGPLGELLSVNVFFQRELRERIDAVACVNTLFERYRIASVELVGAVPSLCATLPAEARRRGIPVRGERPNQTLLNSLRATATVVSEFYRGLRDRQRACAMSHALVALRSSGEAPKLWIAISGRWRPTARHVVENIAVLCEQAGIPYGVVFVHDLGGPRNLAAGVFDELAWFDGTLGRLRPSRVAVANMPLGLFDELRALQRFASRVVPTLVRCAKGAAALRVGDAIASLPDDYAALARTATHAVRRTIESEIAARHFITREGAPHLVIFGCPIFGEVQIFDRLLQTAGSTTLDYAHGTACEMNTATHWRSVSALHASWTRVEARRFVLEGTHRQCRGGYLPALPPNVERAKTETPIVLALGGYLHPLFEGDMRLLAHKHARRFSASLRKLAGELSGHGRIILRPHPAEDRAAWRALLGEDAGIELSDESALATDLARARLVVSVKTSAVIEALATGLPVLLHRGFAVEPTSFFAYFAGERSFSSGDELVEKARSPLAQGAGEPESRVLEACFGPRRQPAVLWEWVEKLISQRSAGERALG